MDIKINGKELHGLTQKELFELSKEVKLAQLKLQQKDLQQFNPGDKVRLNKQMGGVEGFIEEINSKSVVVNTGNRKLLVSAKMMEKI
jgi:preprotein translocase subunit YajC